MGYVNSMLGLAQVLVRFYLLVNHSIFFYFKQNVQKIRVHNFMSSRFTFFNKFKNLYHRNTVISTSVLFCISIFGALVILNEFEGKMYSITGLREMVYYVCISMSQVGYGNITSISVPGRVSVILSLFLASSLMGFFVVAL